MRSTPKKTKAVEPIAAAETGVTKIASERFGTIVTIPGVRTEELSVLDHFHEVAAARPKTGSAYPRSPSDFFFRGQ